MTNVEVLCDDADGRDLLIDDRHNVNFVPVAYGLTNDETHTARDGSPMQVQFHGTLHTYYVEVVI